MGRNARLEAAKQWIKTYSGKNIVKGYARWYAVDLLCAIKELRMINVTIDAGYEAQVKKSMEAQSKWKQQKRADKKKEDITNSYSDDEFFFIAGYTSNGVPYGIMREDNFINITNGGFETG